MATLSVTARPRRRGGIASGGLSRGLLFLLATLLLLMVAAASLAVGARELPLDAVVGAFTGFDGSYEHVLVRDLRVPRLALGMAVGTALGLAGMLMQGITRNPIADPGILGVSSGSALLVVAAIAFLGIIDPGVYMWFALAGAAVASVLVFVIASAGRGRPSPMKLVLAGAVLSALFSAVTMAVLVADDAALNRFRFWNVGSLAGQDMEVLWAVLPLLVAGAILALVSGRALNALSLGDEVATSLGQRTLLVRASSTVGIVLLAGGAVAAAGPIAFVGLAVPHAARTLVGPDYRWIGLFCLVLGPILLVAADTLGRYLGRPGEIQVGIMTAFIGVPVFIALVRQRRMAEV